MKGGYIEVNVDGLNLASPGRVDGIYVKLLKALRSGKLVVLADVQNGGIYFTPIPCFLALDGTTIILTIMNIPYHVASTDVVTQE